MLFLKHKQAQIAIIAISKCPSGPSLLAITLWMTDGPKAKPPTSKPPPALATTAL